VKITHYLRRFSKAYLIKPLPLLFIISFCVWMFAFRGFILDEIPMTSDATAYFDHFEYYLKNIIRGVYPMWESTRAYGVPIDLYMRRIGSFNPTFYLILLMNFLGIPLKISCNLFLCFYFFSGMVGFYLICKHVIKNTTMSFVAYLLLMFSSLGTRIFDSYIVLTLVPMIWFFYFLVAFSKKPERHNFLGIIFTLMILFTTYIPFYFVTIVMIFFIFYCIFYFSNFIKILLSTFRFIKHNKLFSGISVFLLIVSLLPGLLFFGETKRGEIVMPLRHYSSEDKNEIAVDIKTVSKWGIEEDFVYSSTFNDFRQFKFAIFYLPICGYVLLFMGLFTRLKKRSVFLFLLGLCIAVMFAHRLPVYKFLFQKIFYFKYFRNLHFFLWLFILPLFILFLIDHVTLSFENLNNSNKRRFLFFLYVTIIHSGFFYFLYNKNNAISSSYASLILSYLSFLIYFWGSAKWKKEIVMFLFLAAITVQPVEVYHYLSVNSQVSKENRVSRYGGKTPFWELDLPLSKELSEISRAKKAILIRFANYKRKLSRVYMCTKLMNHLMNNYNYKLLNIYSSSKLIAYDNLQRVDYDQLDFKKFKESLFNDYNLAYISKDDPVLEGESNLRVSSQKARIITRESKEVEILDVNVNHLKIKTKFSNWKFLAYNDSFYPGWRAFINGSETQIYQTNVAFKGVLLPPGENIILFKFDRLYRYILNMTLVFVFIGVFICLIIFIKRNNSLVKKVM